MIDHEIDHDESDEGVHEHDPNFEGNDPLFERRAFDLSHQNDTSNKHKTLQIKSNAGNKNRSNGAQNLLVRNASEGSDLEKQGNFRRGATTNNNANGGRNNSQNSNNNSKSVSPTKPPLGGASR